MTLFLSDLHLGHPRVRGERASAFLSQFDRDQDLYLVGDTFDDLSAGDWPESHAEVLRAVLSFRRVVVLPGNHDGALRCVVGLSAGHVSVAPGALLYDASSARRYLVTHGDGADPFTRLARGPRLVQRVVRAATDWLWPDSALRIWMKRVLIQEARRRGCSGVICGHCHLPGRESAAGADFVSLGDWIGDSPAAAVDLGGELELVAA